MGKEGNQLERNGRREDQRSESEYGVSLSLSLSWLLPFRCNMKDKLNSLGSSRYMS